MLFQTPAFRVIGVWLEFLKAPLDIGGIQL